MTVESENPCQYFGGTNHRTIGLPFHLAIHYFKQTSLRFIISSWRIRLYPAMQVHLKVCLPQQICCLRNVKEPGPWNDMVFALILQMVQIATKKSLKQNSNQSATYKPVIQKIYINGKSISCGLHCHNQIFSGYETIMMEMVLDGLSTLGRHKERERIVTNGDSNPTGGNCSGASCGSGIWGQPFADHKDVLMVDDILCIGFKKEEVLVEATYYPPGDDQRYPDNHQRDIPLWKW